MFFFCTTPSSCSKEKTFVKGRVWLLLPFDTLLKWPLSSWINALNTFTEKKRTDTQLELIFVPFGKSILDAQRLTNDGQSKILQGVSWLSNGPEKKTRMTKTAPSVKHERPALFRDLRPFWRRGGKRPALSINQAHAITGKPLRFQWKAALLPHYLCDEKYELNYL